MVVLGVSNDEHRWVDACLLVKIKYIKCVSSRIDLLVVLLIWQWQEYSFSFNSSVFETYAIVIINFFFLC